MGLTFVLETVYLLPLTVLFLTVSVGALAFRANRRRGYGPFALGVLAGLLLLMGKFFIASEFVVYLSIGLLIGASVWNSWPKRRVSFAPAEPLLQLGEHQQGA